MTLSASEAWLYLPFVAPICVYVFFTDIRSLKIKNHATDLLTLLFIPLGLIALPFDEFLWRCLHFVVVLVIGMMLTFVRLVGAGDAKFAAGAAPYIAAADWRIVMLLYCINLIAAFATHRLAKFTALRKMADGWESWDSGKKFPMGMVLGGTLVSYLAIVALLAT